LKTSWIFPAPLKKQFNKDLKFPSFERAKDLDDKNRNPAATMLNDIKKVKRAALPLRGMFARLKPPGAAVNRSMPGQRTVGAAKAAQALDKKRNKLLEELNSNIERLGTPGAIWR